MPDRKHERFVPGKRVAVDMDDVVVSFMPNLLSPGGVFEREFGEVPEWDGASWGDLAVKFTKHPKLLAAGYKSWWEWLRHRDWLWGLAEPVPGAIGALETLRHRGYFVHLVTSKPEWAEPQVWKWLGRYELAVNAVTVVRPGERKLDFSDAPVIIDDKFETCLEWSKNDRRGLWFNRHGVITMEQDSHLGMMSDITLVSSWDEVLEVLT